MIEHANLASLTVLDRRDSLELTMLVKANVCLLSDSIVLVFVRFYTCLVALAGWRRG